MALGLPTTLNVPLDGILVPAGISTATIPALGGAFPAFVTGTPIGGLLSDVLTMVPRDLAAAVGGPPAPIIPMLP